MDVYFGESKCAAICTNGNPCKNNAYYIDNKIYLCGVHSKKDSRKELQKNPNKMKIIANVISVHKESYLKMQKINQKTGKQGLVICSKMTMMKKVCHVNGYISIFPNCKHGNRKDGIGLPELSPMKLGPIICFWDNDLQSHNLENYWQCSKLYPSQKLECDNNNHSKCQNSCFRKYQTEMFNDIEPHRHNKFSKVNNKKVAPNGWVWTYKDGSTKLFPYVESRQFYCNYYERLAIKTKAFRTLKDLLNDGMNLNIIGYDGWSLNDENVDNLKVELMKLYLNSAQPFGYELCIVSLLIFDNPEEYPWRIHKTEEF